jgi:Ca-activated chloride channel homolog
MSRLHRLLLVAALVAPIPLLGDVGVLIPSGSSTPNPAILSLDQMVVDIRIDNGDARVSVRQIFASHVGGVLEGEYLFSMPSRATVSDFAVWDGVTRIPGVILERRRAEEIYENLKQQQIDPGLLQQGERGIEGAAEATRTSAFSARIVPIFGFGTKRLEMEYHEVLPVENLRSAFALPLRPDAHNAQSASELTISFTLVSAHPIQDFRVGSRTYPLALREQGPHSIVGSFTGRNVTLSEDFSIEYSLDPGKTDTLEVVTYRNPEPGAPNPT